MSVCYSHYASYRVFLWWWGAQGLSGCQGARCRHSTAPRSQPPSHPAAVQTCYDELNLNWGGWDKLPCSSATDFSSPYSDCCKKVVTGVHNIGDECWEAMANDAELEARTEHAGQL